MCILAYILQAIKVVTLKLTDVLLQKKTINLNFLKSLALNRNYK